MSEKDIKNICIISSGYPTDNNPRNTFVDQLVCQFANKNIKCNVISPQSVNSYILDRKKKQKGKWVKRTDQGKKINIYAPKYCSLSNKNIIKFNTAKITLKMFKMSVEKEFKKLKERPDVIYAHFINPSGVTATYLGEKYNIPVFIACGESSSALYDVLGEKVIERTLNSANGVIAVSTKNKEMIESKINMDFEKIKVLPNGIDSKVFYKMDRKICRKKLGISDDDFTICFVGSFIERKGPLRLMNAVNNIEGVKVIFIGDGPQIPKSEKVLFCGKVSHNQISEYLSSSDVFVLPTLNEGCCNAIVEAMACGLPVISSNLKFNDDILNETNSIRIDPQNIHEINMAIKLLKNNEELREKLSKGALNSAVALNVEDRAKKIINFIESRI